MQQRDYLLREIEKIGMMLRAIRQKIIGGSDDLEFTQQQRVEDAKGMLINDLNFDLEAFLVMDDTSATEYITNVEALNAQNLDFLAECISKIGEIASYTQRDLCYLKALFLYDLSSRESKTYSFEREMKIAEIRSKI